MTLEANKAPLKITVLTDNSTVIDRYLLGEPALALWIEEGGRRILFDCGYSDATIRNAQALGIDLMSADDVVLSHGHADHTWGLIPLLQEHARLAHEGRPSKRPRFVAHPAAFWSRSKDNVPETGSLIGEDRLRPFGDLVLTTQPFRLTESVLFLGEIPTQYGFEVRESDGLLRTPDGVVADTTPDDSALACQTGSGLVVVTGCAHSGICSILDRARALTGEQEVYDILGGFHLYDAAPDRIERTASVLESICPRHIHACHCTGIAARCRFSRIAPPKEVGAGLTLSYG